MEKAKLDERDWLYVLTMISGLGRKKIREMLEMTGSFQVAIENWHEVARELRLTSLITAQVDKQSNDASALALLEKREEEGTRFLCPFDDAYPVSLRNIPDSPWTLFYRGDLTLLGKMSIGVVGSRKPTPYGRASCSYFVREMVQAGLVIVSGVAYGIDAEAHQATLKADGKTIGVLGCGMNHVYPSRHRELYREIESFGLLLSEYPPHIPPVSGLFPERNRIISGLSIGVLVVEAAEKSGSLITADCALEQGKEVFAIPGPIFSLMSAGPHNLIKQGAKLVTCSNDIWEEIKHLLPKTKQIQLVEKRNATDVISLSNEEKAIVQAVTYEGIHLDELMSSLEKDQRRMLHQLVIRLEAKGAIVALPGGYFARR
ncbi:DNA-protecting protein DprA [Brevibacillus antibioticus]|uniref:DNA-protecting protein DprA n=1 Tax=Brevibacillus antibioticus TaxID=2570228 RepID=A0A4U2Y3H6_9BACL|nr:DNA-processing protein DprA [Brevibacillus antibioticus]TKI54947.1 DNA-protecting protein DprA [Brevibacillus antibioticus]